MTQMVALLIGAVFSGGLYLAGMTNPSKILNFLDIAGTWDPSLMFVMGGGIPVAAISFFILKKCEKPLIFDEIQVPTHGVIDQPLVIGSVLLALAGAFRVFVRAQRLLLPYWNLRLSFRI